MVAPVMSAPVMAAPDMSAPVMAAPILAAPPAFGSVSGASKTVYGFTSNIEAYINVNSKDI